MLEIQRDLAVRAPPSMSRGMRNGGGSTNMVNNATLNRPGRRRNRPS
jgi:hypothetical protein